MQLGGFPRSRAELDGFDTLIVGNVDPRTWPKGLARTISDAVSEGGKSLIVIAGPNLEHWMDVAELRQILPVEIAMETATPVAGPIPLRPTPEGTATGWFSLGAASAGSLQRLPPVEHAYPALRKRPAASVLVEAEIHANAYGPLIVMAQHDFGRGRVLFIATDSLWRWQTLGPRNEAGVTLYTAFWQQALRALAPSRSTSSQPQLWLRPERTLYRAGEQVRLSADWIANADEGAAQAVVVTSTVVLPDGRRVPLDLAADPADPQRHGSQFEATLPGRYRLEAVARTEARTVAEAATSVEVTSAPAESDPAPVDASALARLASATGGRLVDPLSADGWLAPSAAERLTTVERRSFDLWHNFSLLLLLSVLLAADWTLRLFRGYV